MNGYVRPIARHRAYPARLLVRDDEDRWLVWHAEPNGREPEEIAEATAWWLLAMPWIEPLPIDCAWIDVADLPLTSDAGTARPRP